MPTNANIVVGRNIVASVCMGLKFFLKSCFRAEVLLRSSVSLSERNIHQPDAVMRYFGVLLNFIEAVLFFFVIVVGSSIVQYMLL